MRHLTITFLLLLTSHTAHAKNRAGQLDCAATRSGAVLDGIQEDVSTKTNEKTYVCVYVGGARGEKLTAKCKASERPKREPFKFSADGGMSVVVNCE